MSALSGGFPLQGHAAGYTFTPIDVPGATQTFATSINDVGQVAGFYSDDTGDHGFVDTNGVYTSTNVTGVMSGTEVYGINASGELVGFYRDQSGAATGFLYAAGVFTSVALNVPPSSIGHNYDAIISSVNDLGQAVKVLTTTTFLDTSVASSLYSNGLFSALTVPIYGADIDVRGINNSGQITGFYGSQFALTGSTTSSFVATSSVLTPVNVPGSYANTTLAEGINNLGEVAGSYRVVRPVGNIFEDLGFIDNVGLYTTLQWSFPGRLIPICMLSTMPDRLWDRITTPSVFSRRRIPLCRNRRRSLSWR